MRCSLSLSLSLALLFSLICGVFAAPNHYLQTRVQKNDDSVFNITANEFGNWDVIAARQTEKPLLRIMPLGASITQGVGSNPEDGE